MSFREGSHAFPNDTGNLKNAFRISDFGFRIPNFFYFPAFFT